ncbi:MAG TPA: DUF6624 domain-containing protein, partial [Planctomycetota bacterium]|nr:DUF6624 domain-containing protein [Planctomycetota bacterium]
MRNPMIILAIAGILVVAPGGARAQDYAAVAAQAQAAYTARDWTKAVPLYRQLAALPQATAGNVYDAACTMALAGLKDEAFAYLEQALDRGFSSFFHLTDNDADLASLRNDARWPQIVAKVDAKMKATLGPRFDADYRSELMALYRTDQAVRADITKLIEKHGMQSPQVDSVSRLMHEVDSANVARLEALIATRGWPEKSVVTAEGATAAFLVIQHSSLPVMEKYLPVMREAAASDEMSKSQLAMLEDRVLMFNGKPQLYGTQLKYNEATGKPELAPIEDEANVEARRKAVGLGP